MATVKRLSDLRNDENSDYAKFKKRREEKKEETVTQAASEEADPQEVYLQQVRENEKLNQMKGNTESDYAKFIKRRNSGYLESNLQQKKKAQEDFLESEENVGFWDAMLPGGATPSEYKQSRQKKKQYEKETQEAAAQVAAYEQLWEQQRIAGKSSAEIDAYIAESDAQIEKLEEEKGSFWDAMKPGGVKPSEYNANRKAKEAEIKKIESQQGMYRAVRDEKKSHEMTDELPEDVIKLLDEYNNLEYEDEGVDWAGVAAGFAGMSGSGTNAVQRSSADLRREAIKKELTERGYDNYVELAEYRRYITDKAASEEQTERWSEVAEEHPVLASAGARVASVPSAVSGLYGTIKQYENTADFVGGTPYSPYYNAERARQTIDNTITEGFEDGIISADAKAFFYSAGASAADSMMASVASGSLGLGKLTAGEVLLGLGAANNVVVTAAEKGMTQEQAMTTAAVAMASEIAFEHLSLGKLGVFEASGEVAVKAAIKDLVKNSFVNMTEEMATEIANVTFDYYYNGGLSDYYQKYETYIAMGYSEEEAEQMARADVNNQILEAGLSGALIGGVFSGVETGTNVAGYNAQLKDIGKQAVNEGNVDAVLAGASDIKGNEVVSNLISEVEGIQNTAREKANLKGKEYRTIGKLMEQLDKVTGEDRSRLIETAVRNRLTELGEVDGIDVKTSAISKVIENGGRAKEDAVKLTKAERKAIKKGTYTQRVLNEIGDAAGVYSSAWVDTLAEDVDSLYKKRYEPDVEAYKSGKSSQEDPSLSGTENGAAAEQKKTASGKSESEILKMLDDDNMKAAENAKAQVKQALIQQGQDVETFNAGFELYYEQGRSGGYQFTEIKDNTNVSESFTEYQRQQAFELGVHHKLKDVGNAKYKGGTVDVFVNGYTRKNTVNSYAKAFDIFYAEGVHTKKSFDAVVKEQKSLLEFIDEGVARKAFEEGRALPKSLRDSSLKYGAKAPAKSKQKKDGSYVSKTIEEGEIDTFLEAFSKKLGLDTVRVQKIIDGEDEANAQIDLKSGKMVSSASSRNEYQSTIHESVHLAYAYGDTNKMAEIETSMKDYFIHLHGASVFENVLRQYAEAYTDLDRAGVMEEFTADALAGVFSSEKGVNEFVDWLQKDSGYSQAEKKTILQKLSEWLLEIIDKIRELVEEGHLNNVTEAYAKAQAEQFTEVRDKFLQVLDEIEGVEGAVEGDVRDSLKKSDVSLIQSFGVRKSINDFNSAEIKKTKTMAEMYYKQLGTKSPFFRAWFGDWRAYDTTPIAIADVKGKARGKTINLDTKWEINISRILFNESKSHNSIRNKTALPYLDYINDIVQKAVLLDTSTIKNKKSENSLFMHSFYSIADIGNGPELLKLYVEEMNDVNIEETSKRAYQLQNIEKQQVVVTGSQNNSVSRSNQPTVISTISDLFALVKQKDKDFQPNPVNKALLNDNGTPMILYHQTENDFMVFDVKHKGSGSSDYATPYGVFMKPSTENIGLKGDKQMPLYARIINPLQVSDREELEKILMQSQKFREIKQSLDEMNADYKEKSNSANNKLISYLVESRKKNPERTRSDILEDKEFLEIKEEEETLLKNWGIETDNISATAKDIVTEYLKKEGYDGLIIEVDKGSFGRKTKTIIALGNTQVKSATNNVGTFDSESSDIRRSRKFSLDWIDFAEEQERERSAVSELTELKKINDELRAKIQHPGVKHIVSQLGVQKVARHLKGEYMSKINIHKLAGELGDFYTLIANGDGISWDSLQIHIERIADMILGESKYKKPDISDYAKDVLRELRSSKISLSEEQKAAISEKYGSYNNYRKKMMGSLVLSNDGTSLDERWTELSGMYPNLFSEDTVDLDQPEAMLELIASLRETYEDMNGLDYESAKDMLMTEIYEQYFEVPETKYISEEYALKIAKAKVDYGERLKEAKADFRRQRDEAYKKAKEEFDQAYKKGLAEIRQEEAETILRIKARYNLRAENMADTRVREKKRANIIRQVKRLDRLLRTPSKGAPSAGTNKYEQKYVHLTNIPEDLKRTVIDFCSVFIEHDAGVFSGYKKSDSVTVREKKIEALQKQYKLLKQTDVYLKESVVEGMAEKLDKVAELMAERRLSQLSASELDTVIEITDHLITVINNQVEMWVDGKKHKVEGLGSAAVDQLKEKGQYKHLPLPGHDFVKGWGVNNMKPVYFFERVGGVLEKLFLEMQNKGQRDYARNINAAAAFMDEASKRFDYKKWSDAEPLTLKTTQGDTLKLTKAQAMHIWATAKREVIAGKDSMHLMQGGIVFEDEIEADFEVDNKKDKSKKNKLSSEVWKYKKSDGSAHRISLDDLDKISEYLTDEQKKFVDTMVGYLSNDMAALGNEVSMELYGIRRFNEKYYIPFNSAKNFIYRSMGEQGEAMLRSESFTKETTWGANNPLVVGDFLDVVAGHIERMAMYNSMVMPLENFSKIWNFKTFVPEGDEITSQVSVRSAMETAFGKSYVSYVDTLLKDINGGINADSREKSIGRLLSNFKKTAVLGSASVVIQQPSAIVRAFAEIDPSYFVASTFAKRKAAWEKALKYSSTALLKDIGGFDTVSGRGTTDWLTKIEYKGKDKVLKFFSDSQYRDDILAWGPSFADKVTWAHIWAACEREVASKNKGLQGEELYKKTGERFDEVINKTQVYDSVLARSAHMRSKSQTMQVVTSFMSEPTTQANMIASAMFNAKKGDKKKAARIYSSVILSQLFNAALVSAIYAARDDDEDKTLVEKYLAELASNFVGSLNPLTMIPLFKDVWSLLEGYDVERSDMAVYADVVDSWKAWKSDSKTLAEKVTGTIGSIGNAFGLPLKNILRDAAAVVNVAKSAGDISDTTSKGVFYALEESLFPVHENLTKWKPTTKEEKLYAAFSEGDKKMYNRIASQYTSGGKIKSDLKKQIGERFVEGDIDERTAISQFRKLGLTENEAYYEVRNLKEPLPEEESEDTNADFFDFDSMQSVQGNADAESGEAKGDYDWLENALATGNRADIQKEINDLKNRGVPEDDINSKIKSWIKTNDSTVIAEAERYKQGNLNSFESTVKSISSKYGVDESSVAGAIRSAAGDKSKAIEGTIYAYGDLHASIGSVNTAQTQNIASSIINAKTEGYLSEGMTRAEAQKKAKQSVRSSLTSEWKPIYLAATSTERVRIRQQLYATGAYDSVSHLDDILKGWREGN